MQVVGRPDKWHVAAATGRLQSKPTWFSTERCAATSAFFFEQVRMISHDELTNGMTFVLQLRNAAGVASQWMETLRGDVARRWYEIYRSSDWPALRLEAASVFRHSVTEAQMDNYLKAETRCISIQTPSVKVEELSAAPAAEQAKP
jgi:hypothetical protein